MIGDKCYIQFFVLACRWLFQSMSLSLHKYKFSKYVSEEFQNFGNEIGIRFSRTSYFMKTMNKDISVIWILFDNIFP